MVKPNSEIIIKYVIIFRTLLNKLKSKMHAFSKNRLIFIFHVNVVNKILNIRFKKLFIYNFFTNV